MLSSVLLVSLLVSSSTSVSSEAGQPMDWSHGKPPLESIGELAFGEAGILFLADPQAASVFAIKTELKGSQSALSLLIESPDAQIAALLGTTAMNIAINDIAVHPKSGDLYLSVTRGSGAGSQPALVMVDGSGRFKHLTLENIDFMQKRLSAAVDDQRAQSITDLVYFDGRLYVAGLSNEEFASNLRSLAFPFDQGQDKTPIEIYHANHGAYETRAPIRTFLPYDIDGEAHLVAAYTCTPLVTFSVTDLKPGQKVRGKTVAELGGGNRPLDMLGYEKNGERFILMSNSRHGVIKIPTEDIGKVPALSQPVAGKQGLGYDSIQELDGVLQMTSAGPDAVAVLIREPDSKSLMLGTIELP